MDFRRNFSSGPQIDSDFNFSLKILKTILMFIITLIPYIFLGLFYFLIFNFEKGGSYFAKIFVVPFNLFKDFSDWFFQAKFTAYLFITLIVCFFIQIFYLNFNEELLHSLMTHSGHFFVGNFHSVLTSIFLHGSISHLIGNLVALLVFGRIVEKHFESKFLFIFLGSGVIANIISNMISYFSSNSYYSLGASGGIAGLVIFAILLNPFSFTTLFLFPLPIFLVGWFLIYLDFVGLSQVSTTNHLAHIGGYLALLVLFFFIELRNRKRLYVGLSINIFMMILIYLVLRFVNLGLF